MRAGLSLKSIAKPAVFIVCLLPLAWLGYRGLTDGLGANPIEATIRYLGDWALRFVLIALAVTPLRIVTGWNAVTRFRRMLGLFAFTYALLHVLAYAGLDQLFDLAAIWKDILKRVYITIGMAALLMLLPLAITSTDAMVRRLGGRAWRHLHRLAYPAGIAAVIHYALMIKAGYGQAIVYGVILAILLAIRAGASLRRRATA